jgi:hypothetical protein
MIIYKEITIDKLNEVITVIEKINDDGTVSYIPNDPANADYQAYLNKDNPDYGKPQEL